MSFKHYLSVQLNTYMLQYIYKYLNIYLVYIINVYILLLSGNCAVPIGSELLKDMILDITMVNFSIQLNPKFYILENAKKPNPLEIYHVI